MKQSNAVLVKARTDRSITVDFFPVWHGEYVLRPNTLSIFGYGGYGG
jgi:hypothetical protein